MHPLIAAAALAARLDEPDWIVFDVRHDLMAPDAGEAAYRADHLPGARFASVDRVLSGPKTATGGRHPLPDRDGFASWLASRGAHADSTLVAYDASNALYAARFWWMVRWLGHARVAVLDGGLPAWAAAGLPTTTMVPTPVPGDLVAQPSTLAVVDTAAVAANVATPRRLLVDARAAERYRGEVEPLDRVPGHIPGAINHPMALNLGPDGRFKAKEALCAIFDEELGQRPASDVIQSCGSGITACHNLLAMEVAGLEGAALYAGSYSAWSADPSRPVATGDQGPSP